MKPVSHPAVFEYSRLFLLGLAVFFPGWSILKAFSQGDQGRDLYCFWRTAEGALPYLDYQWNYGPLMPFYYAGAFKLFGATVATAQAALLFLKILCGFAMYAAVRVFFSWSMATLAAVWFWYFNPDFFYTYNHAGAVFGMLAAAALLFDRLKNPGSRRTWAAPAVLWLVCLVKLNAGLAIAAAFALSLFAGERMMGWPASPRRLYAALLAGVPLATAAVYAPLIAGLPPYYLRQCFPFFKGYDQSDYFKGETHQVIRQWFSESVLGDWRGLATAALFLAGFVSLRLLIRRRPDQASADALRAAVPAAMVMILFSLHELFLSAMPYRLYWGTPLCILFLFLVLSAAAEAFPGWRARALQFFLAAVLLAEGGSRIVAAGKNGGPATLWRPPRAQVHVMNGSSWREITATTCAYLQDHLRPDETFFALPHEAGYYFLLRREAPVRELMFFRFMNVTRDQEKDIIRRLEEKKVRYVVLSNRSHSREEGLGLFGKDYCPLLIAYLRKNFVPAAQFGEWKAEAGWVKNHAVRIYQRKPAP